MPCSLDRVRFANCSTTRACSRSAATAALRAHTLDQPVPGLDTLDHPEAPLAHPVPGLDRLDHPDPGLDRLDHPDGLEEPVGPVDGFARMDAFARRVGFTPTRLPDWLTARTHQGASDGAPVKPGFVFDWSRLLPSLTMFLHLSAEDLATGEGGVVRWEGEGPVTHQFVHDHLRPLHAYDLRPVIDLAHQAPTDGYEIPDRLRQAVHLRTPADTFPYSSSTSRAVDLDHTREYTPHAHRSRKARRAGELDPGREPRTSGPVPPPDQDPRQLDPAPTLRRHLPLARPPRPDLPRRPHRHPPGHPLRPPRRDQPHHHRVHLVLDGAG